VKFAILAGRTDLTASELALQLTVADESTPVPLTTSDLRAASVIASIQFGSFGTATWQAADWDAPFIRWISGPQMSSWIYRKPIGSDAHLVGWLEVRLYRGGAVELVPWIENGYCKVPSATSKSGMAAFTLGGSSRFSQSLTLLNRQRVYLGSGSTLSHWLDADPRVVPRHDTSYFQQTRLTPAYLARTSSVSPLWSSIVTTYTPLARGSFSLDMTDGGYQPAIGPMPEWDVAYLSSGGDARAFAAVQVHGYLAGRYGIHYRDESTNRPVRFSQRPNLSINDSGSGIFATGGGTLDNTTPGSGGAAPVYDNAHHPLFGYMAYLLTGRFYFMEEVQFLATVNYLKNAQDTRGYAQGYFNPGSSTNQNRGAAWSIRSLVAAANVTPDDDALQADLRNSCGSNVTYFNTNWGPSRNNLGIATGTNWNLDQTGATYQYPPWQDDWITYAFGFMAETKVCPTAQQTTLISYFAWKAQSIVGRLGADTGYVFDFKDAAPYGLLVAQTTAGLNSPANWRQSWGEVYALAFGSNTAGGTALRGSSGGDPGVMSTGYWGNLMPAISVAVDLGVAGALEGYNRMIGASNWSSSAAGFNDSPVWSVRPRSL
jgi:hypothetical protein